MSATVSAVLDELRPTLVADGTDLELLDCTDGVATIRLVLAPDACQECIVPRAMFEKILSAKLIGRVPEVRSVTLIDPRETSSP